MKKSLKQFGYVSLAIVSASLLNQASTFAGVGAGGGGDAATEMRIDEIRADILKWIDEGGARELKLPRGVTYGGYVGQMSAFLQRHSVIISSVTTQQEMDSKDPEQKVSIDGVAKTCRSFISAKDERPHILCNLERFAATNPAAQYRLIHHEYAGLVGVEKNDGALSDYEVSNQLTDFLRMETVLRLAVKKPATQIPQALASKIRCKVVGTKLEGPVRFKYTETQKEFFIVYYHGQSSISGTVDGDFFENINTVQSEGWMTYSVTKAFPDYRADRSDFHRYDLSSYRTNLRVDMKLRLNLNSPGESLLLTQESGEHCSYDADAWFTDYKCANYQKPQRVDKAICEILPVN